MNSTFIVRVLGPVDVVTGAGPTHVGGRHQQKLLAALVLAANHLVSTDHLAQVLWADSPPPSRDNTLQTDIHRLRSLLGPEAIVAEDHSYMLRVEPEQVDALEFENLVMEAVGLEGAPEGRIELCMRALRHWRGEPFGDLGREDPFRLEAIRLGELRLFVMELKLESDIAAGRFELAVGPLSALVEEHPYNEKLWCMLMEALSLSGRRVEALRAFDRLTGLLADVGLTPTAELRDMERRIAGV